LDFGLFVVDVMMEVSSFGWGHRALGINAESQIFDSSF